jgi:hypothetical protein
MRYAPTIAFAAALCLLAACSDAAPTAPSDLRADGTSTGTVRDSTYSEDGGYLLGSGNVIVAVPVSGDGTSGEQPTNLSTSNGSGGDSSSSEDGGYLLGSGNRGGSSTQPGGTGN